MPLGAGRALTAAALGVSALLAAGCGSKPEPAKPKPPASAPAAVPAQPAKSEAPVPPAPPKPAEIAWGEAVGGLQVGLQIIGSREEMRLRCMADLTRFLAVQAGAGREVPVVELLDRVMKDGKYGALWQTAQRLRMFLAGGLAFSEALQRSGLITEQDLLGKVKAGEAAGDLPGAMAGLAEALAGKAQSRGSFLEGEDIFTFVSLRNVGDRELNLSDSFWLYELLLSFARPDGWPVVRYRDPSDQWKDRGFKPLTLPANGEVATVLAVRAEERWGFEPERRPDGSFASPTRLQPGRYTVNVGYEPRERKQPVPCWRGRISGGPVEIEVRSKPGEVFWGEAVNGLRLGLARPDGPFAVGEPARMTLLVENVSEEPKTILRMLAVDRVGEDCGVVIRRQDGSVIPTKGECCKKHAFGPLVVKPKEARKLLLDPLNQGCFGVRELPPGKYTVEVLYEHAPHAERESCPYWHGKLTTGPMEIEFRPKSAAAPLSEAEIVARARAIGRQRWPEQTGDASGQTTFFDERPAVTRERDNWRVVFQQGVLEVAGARATVRLDAAGREISTWCEWVPD